MAILILFLLNIKAESSFLRSDLPEAVKVLEALGVGVVAE